MDNAQNSDKASEKQEKEAENKNDKVTPEPPTEDKKTPQSVKSVSGPGDRKSRETVEKKTKSSKIQFKPQSKPTEKQKGEAKPKNKDASKTLVSPRDMVTPRDLDVKENQPGKEKRERHMALLLSWEVNWNLLGIAARLTNGNKLSDFSYVALSPPTKDSEWTPPVDQSSLVIFYSSPKSERPLYQMERYLDYCSRKKGPGKVIVVIGEEEDDDVNEKWKENQFSKTLDQFRFSRAELDWITREDILQEMLEKIEKLRKSLISPTTGLQEKPSGNEEVKQVPQITEKIQPAKQVKMKKQETNKQNKDNKAKMPKTQKETPSKIKTQLERHEKKREEMRQAVRIVSWSKTDSRWLVALLRSPYFRDAVKDVETVNVIGGELEKMTEQTSSVTTYILYFSKESLELFGSQLHNSVKLLSTFEKKKIMVVIDNLDNKYTEKEVTKRYAELPISSLSKHLFLFGTREMETDYLTHLTKKQQVTQEAAQKMTKFQNLINQRRKSFRIIAVFLCLEVVELFLNE
ncbi:uncharacterized protein LOC120942955 [Rana temporaria]|uniref:uncharacterized protein LOC120942955 n=1 Tax=Rana temporaria TaxID=8407 RepID=UPI001AADD2B0|nr:uncharacterized protein LOC120942955 [Rana temporaria]